MVKKTISRTPNSWNEKFKLAFMTSKQIVRLFYRTPNPSEYMIFKAFGKVAREDVLRLYSNIIDPSELMTIKVFRKVFAGVPELYEMIANPSEEITITALIKVHAEKVRELYEIIANPTLKEMTKIALRKANDATIYALCVEIVDPTRFANQKADSKSIISPISKYLILNALKETDSYYVSEHANQAIDSTASNVNIAMNKLRDLDKKILEIRWKRTKMEEYHIEIWSEQRDYIGPIIEHYKVRYRYSDDDNCDCGYEYRSDYKSNEEQQYINEIREIMVKELVG